MRLWILGPLMLGMACQPIDEASMRQYLPPGDDMGGADELGDEPKWNAGQSVLPMDFDGPVVGEGGRQRILEDSLGWPGDLEGMPPYSLDDMGYSFSGNERLTWCLRQPSTHDSDDVGDEPDMTVEGQKIAIQAAADEWMLHANFKLREVDCSGWSPHCTADIEVEFLNESDALYERKLGIRDPETDLVVRYSNAVSAPPMPTSGLSGDRGPCTKIYVNDERDWTLSYRAPWVPEEGSYYAEPYDIQSTVLHEMGHSLGLCHPFEYVFSPSGAITGTETSDYCTAATDLDLDLCESFAMTGDDWEDHIVMCPYYDGSTRTLHEDDIASIQSVYGASKGVCSDGYDLAVEAETLLKNARLTAAFLVETYPSEASFGDALGHLETAEFYAAKLKNAAEEARDLDAGRGLVATRYLYDAQIASEYGRDAYLDGDSLATSIVAAVEYVYVVRAWVDEALNVLPVVYRLEDQCYTDEYGEHEEGT